MRKHHLAAVFVSMSISAPGLAAAQKPAVSPGGRPIVSADSVFIVAYRSRSGPSYREYTSYIAARKAALEINTNPDLRANFREVNRRRWESDPAFRKRVIDELATSPRRGVSPPIGQSGGSVSGRASSGITLAGEVNGASATPPGPGLQQVAPDILTGRNYGVRQIDPQVRSFRSGSSLTMDENASRSQARNGPTSGTSPRPGSQASVQSRASSTPPASRSSMQPDRSDNRSRSQRKSAPRPSPSRGSSMTPSCGVPGCTIHR